MLREVKSNRTGSRIITLTGVSTAGTPSITTGLGDVAALSDINTGRALLTVKNPFRLTPMAFATNSTNGISNGYTTIQQPAVNQVEFDTLGAAGAGNDNDWMGMIYGFDCADLGKTKQQSVAFSKDAGRMIFGRIDSSGVVQVGKTDFACTLGATGIFTITFKRPFAKGCNPVVLVTPFSTTSRQPNVTRASTTAAGTTVAIRDSNTGSNANDGFNIVVFGQDSVGEQGLRKTPLLNSQRKPRIIGCRFNAHTGNPTVSIGASEINLVTRTGAGVYAVTFKDAFKREPIIITTMYTTAQQRRCQVSAQSTTGFTARVYDAAASASDSTADFVQCFIIGSDDATEY